MLRVPNSQIVIRIIIPLTVCFLVTKKSYLVLLRTQTSELDLSSICYILDESLYTGLPLKSGKMHWSCRVRGLYCLLDLHPWLSVPPSYMQGCEGWSSSFATLK